MAPLIVQHDCFFAVLGLIVEIEPIISASYGFQSELAA
jgi:hypothetical protein